jgi:hypothetical protein
MRRSNKLKPTAQHNFQAVLGLSRHKKTFDTIKLDLRELARAHFKNHNTPTKQAWDLFEEAVCKMYPGFVVEGQPQRLVYMRRYVRKFLNQRGSVARRQGIPPSTAPRTVIDLTEGDNDDGDIVELQAQPGTTASQKGITQEVRETIPVPSPERATLPSPRPSPTGATAGSSHSRFRPAPLTSAGPSEPPRSPSPVVLPARAVLAFLQSCRPQLGHRLDALVDVGLKDGECVTGAASWPVENRRAFGAALVARGVLTLLETEAMLAGLVAVAARAV